VELSGSVAALGGSCPNVTFNLGGTTVYATAGTQFKAGSCKHLESGQRVAVSGVKERDGRVRAGEIDLKP